MKTMLTCVIAALTACATTAPTSPARPTTVSSAADDHTCKEIPRVDGQPSRCQAVKPTALRR